MNPSGQSEDQRRQQRQNVADALASMTAGGDAVPRRADSDGASGAGSPLNRPAGSAASAASAATPPLSSSSSASDEPTVIAPAPDPSVFARTRTRATPAEAAAVAALERKRTFIPILLTLAALSAAVASLKWLAGADSPFAAFPTWLPLVMVAAALCLLVVAILNMLHVRQALAGGSTTAGAAARRLTPSRAGP